MSDLDRYQYGYDQNSNRLWKANVVGTAAVPAGLDEGYSYDNLNRLTQMQRGVLSGGVVTGTPSREMDYTLDPTGNWSAYLTKTSGTTDLNQTRSHTPVNEITAITSTPGWATPPAYDAAGNMNSFPQPSTPSSAYTAVYDAWNRMVSISDTGGTVATYQYDGRNRRTVKVTTATSETRHFYWTSNWQDIEERVGTATTMDKQYAWGIRYVDELVCRDDTTERIYACQDANFNLTAACNTSGSVVERYLFDPYGNRTIMNASWSVLSDSAYDWVIGFQGLMHDVESGLVYDRGRMFHLVLGSFTQRDPAEYMDGMNLYQDLRSNPVKFQDPYGLCTCNCPAYPVLQSGATPINPDSAHDLAQKWSSYLLDHAKDIPGMAGLGWFASLVDKANEGFDKSAGLQVWDYFAVVPCDANGNPGKTPLFWNTLADVNTLSSVGAYDRTLYYVPGYGNTTVAQWQKSLDSIYAEFDTEFNNWLDGQFPKCASIKSYHL